MILSRQVQHCNPLYLGKSMNINDLPPYQPERPMPKIIGVLGNFLKACIVPFALVFILASSIFFIRQMFTAIAVKLPTLKEENRGVAIYDRQGKFVTTMHYDRDIKPIPLDKMSKHIRNAIVAIEDKNFYVHEGIDLFGIGRAAVKNYKAGKIVEGASTITQQLVRCLYLDADDRSYRRKLTEAVMAINVDLNYSKPKILEAYLNEIYFGDGVYGVERAAQNYFNKHASQLSISESAFLAGLVKAPSELSQAGNRHDALMRQHAIIDNMVEANFITAKEAEKAKLTPLAFKEGPPSVPYPSYVQCVMAVLKRELGDDLWKRGWKVYTNLDQQAQKVAEKTLNQGIKTAPKGINQGALVSMSLKDAGLLAVVGGAGKYEQIQWNRALAPHTAGSSFKPFVYLAALQKGLIQPDTLVNDAPITIKAKGAPDWSPKNFDGRYKGWMPVRTALAQSRNICAVRVAQEVGMNEVVMTARAAGIGSQLENYPSTALGACAVTPLEMCTAYSTLARGGIYMAPQVLRSIQYEDGKEYKIYRATPSANLDSESVAELVDVMQDVIKRGTGTRAKLKGITVAGKTGTSDNAKDLWFVGFTPDTCTAVWGGNDKNKRVRGGITVTGGMVMANIWRNYMTAYYQDHKPPVGIAFMPPSKELIRSIPKYDPKTTIASGFGGLYVDTPANVYPVATTFTQEDVEKEKKIEETGIASAADLQRITAVKKARALAASQPYQQYAQQRGVQNYGPTTVQEYGVVYNDNRKQQGEAEHGDDEGDEDSSSESQQNQSRNGDKVSTNQNYLDPRQAPSAAGHGAAVAAIKGQYAATNAGQNGSQPGNGSFNLFGFQWTGQQQQAQQQAAAGAKQAASSAPWSAKFQEAHQASPYQYYSPTPNQHHVQWHTKNGSYPASRAVQHGARQQTHAVTVTPSARPAYPAAVPYSIQTTQPYHHVVPSNNHAYDGDEGELMEEEEAPDPAPAPAPAPGNAATEELY